MNVRELLGVELPIIQSPMAGVQGSALAVAVSNAGGLGSLPCAMLTPDAIHREIQTIAAQTQRPFNVNFFCHQPPRFDAARDGRWRELLERFYRELGVDPATAASGGLTCAIRPRGGGTRDRDAAAGGELPLRAA
jgi:nitronate monooxygenase